MPHRHTAPTTAETSAKYTVQKVVKTMSKQAKKTMRSRFAPLRRPIGSCKNCVARVLAVSCVSNIRCDIFQSNVIRTTVAVYKILCKLVFVLNYKQIIRKILICE